MNKENIRELKFATTFPDWHPRNGEPTYFAERVRRGLYEAGMMSDVTYFNQRDMAPVNFLKTQYPEWRFKAIPWLHLVAQGNKYVDIDNNPQPPKI